MSDQEPRQVPLGLDPDYRPTEADLAFFTNPDTDAAESANEQIQVPNLVRSKPELFGDEEDGYVSSLRGLKEDLSIEDDARVAYPGSSTHVGVARVFGKENVVHVDPDEPSCETLREHGYQAEPVGVEDFRPEQPLDGIVALNSYGRLTSEILERVLRPGGFIITNNYTYWAHEVAQLPGIKLTAALLPYYGHEDGKIYKGDEIPEDATGISKIYLKIVDGRVSLGSPEDHTFTDDNPRYPDALFVFRYEPQVG